DVHAGVPEGLDHLPDALAGDGGVVQLVRHAAPLGGGHRDAVGLDVVGVAVAAVLVVGDDDLRPVALHEGGEPPRGLVQRDVRERLGVVVGGPAVHAGVAV